MRVLVVQNDPDTRELLQQALNTEGHHVAQALCVRDALRLSSISQDIDVVLVDVQPGHRPSSMEVVKNMRLRLPRGHCVLASGEWDMLEPSCQDYLTVLRKPYGKTELLRALKDCAARLDAGPFYVDVTSDPE